MAVTALLIGGLPTEEKKTVPSGGYLANQFVQAPSGLAGFMDRNYAATAGEIVTIRTEGVAQLPCASGTLADIGDEAWFDSTNDVIVKYPVTPGWRAGEFHVAKVDGQTVCQVKLNAVRPDRGVITKTADYTLSDGESGAVVTNTGASGTITFTLPPAVPGLKYKARVSVAQQLRLDPDETETISLPSTGVPGAAGKYLVADAIGETVSLECVVAGSWSVMGYTGTWTAEA